MSKQVIVNNILISYESFLAKESNQTLLFLHGWRSNKEAWSGIMQDFRLKIKDLSIYALDLPGFGASSVPKQAMSVGDYAEVVAEFIKKLELKNLTLVGHSFGGRVAIKLSAIHPELISKLALVDSAGFAMDERRKGAMNAAAKIVKPIFKPKFMQSLRKKIYEQIGSEDYVATPGVMTESYVKTIGEDLTEDMKKINVPALIVYGDQDTATPPDFGKRMNALIPNSKLVILKDAGHFSFLDKPEEFIEILNNYGL